jgi:hypothetical protein
MTRTACHFYRAIIFASTVAVIMYTYDLSLFLSLSLSLDVPRPISQLYLRRNLGPLRHPAKPLAARRPKVPPATSYTRLPSSLLKTSILLLPTTPLIYYRVGVVQARVGQIVTCFAYRPPSRPQGSLTPTQPGRVTNPTQGHPGPPWEAPQSECRSLRREPKPPA